MWDPVKRRKQVQAFPPNFIHSLDATHMLMSAVMCNEAGMTFASIHDSFWTHACDISRMGSVLRDAFVAMHSEDVIGRLREEFDTRYRGSMYLVSITNHPNFHWKVVQWRKKNGITSSIAEFKLEAERMRLLQSDDAQDRIKGAQMVTPGAMYEAYIDLESVDATKDAAESVGSTAEDHVVATTNKVEDIDSQVSDMDVQEDTTGAAPAANSDHLGEDGEDDANAESSVDTKAGAKKRSASTKHTGTYSVWLPLRFPKVPAKGDFDVTRLRESRYFFH